jgi:lysozyme
MLNYAKLADISHWQGDINYSVFSNQDLDGVIARAGSINYVTGIPYTDYRFEINSDKCAENFDVLGFYWFWRANQDPNLQAQYFCDLIKYKKWNLPPVIDVEASNDIPPNILASRLKTCLDAVETRLEIKPIIYTRASFWNVAVGNPSWASNYHLWCARYRYLDANLEPDITGPWSDGKFKPLSWNTWLMWQYTADGNGLGPKYGVDSSDIDLDYFNGTKEDLYRFAGVLEVPQPPTTDKVEINKELAIAFYEELKEVLT